MTELTITTYDWVPPPPRGFVRDMRLRWACEEAGLAYRVESTPFKDRGPEHFARQPFGQAPFLTDGDVKLFESGACLLHIAGKNEALMPRDAVGEAETLEWVIAALNSVEIVTLPWWFLEITNAPNPDLTGWLISRLGYMEGIFQDREWLAADRFTAADLLMADVLRVPQIRRFGDRPATEAYVARVTDRPAFKKAYADQMAHFAAGD